MRTHLPPNIDYKASVDSKLNIKHDEEFKRREEMQLKVEKIHLNWTKDKEYLAPPSVGTLAEIDSALIVTPPEGFEIGYVPIVTGQKLAE